MQPTIVFISGLVILALLFWYLASDDISRKRKVGTILIAGIVLLCIWSLIPRTEDSEFRAGDLIALGDGYELAVEVIPATDKKGEEIEITQETLDARLRALQDRLQIDGKGATYSSSLPRTITIRMPGFSKTDAEEVKTEIIAEQTVGSLKPGIDLAGGASFTLQVQPKVDEDGGETIEVTSAAIQQAVKTLQGRLNPDGTKDMLIQPQGEDMIIIEMPGVSEEEAAWVREIIQKQSVLELRAVHPDNDNLAPLVAAKERGAPGYRLYSHTYTNDPTG